MDGKQIAKLAKVSKTQNITLHDLQDIINKKVLVNRITLEFLKAQKEYAEISIKLQNYSLENVSEKIPLVEELIRKYESQYSDYKNETNEECLEIYERLNELNVYPKPIYNLHRKISKLNEEMKNLSSRIQLVESQIPQIAEGTQFVIKTKQELADCKKETDFVYMDPDC